MPGTQQTIHLGIRLRGAQLHTAIYSTHSMWADTRGLAVHMHMRYRRPTYSRLTQFLFRFKGVLLASPESRVMSGLNGTQQRLILEIRAVWRWAASLLVAFIYSIFCLISICVSERASKRDPTCKVIQEKLCLKSLYIKMEFLSKPEAHCYFHCVRIETHVITKLSRSTCK